MLAPIGAEYLVGYDTSTGNWSELLGNLVIFAPLYGAPALLIRELAVRVGVGWSGRLCWAAAFGIVQAGLVDHSLFNPGYRDISYWSELVGPTWIPALGFSAAASLGFVVGHLVFSISAPIVVVESIHPSIRHRPWLSPAGTVVAAVAYLAASAFVVQWHLRTEEFLPGVNQLVGAAVVVLALIALGAWLGRRPRPDRAGRTPSPWWFAALGLVATALHDVSQTWVGFAVGVLVLTATFAVVDQFSRTPGWSDRHVLLLAGGALLVRAATGFLVDPIGDGSTVAKYVHNSGAVLLVVALVALGWMRLRVTPNPAPDPLGDRQPESLQRPGHDLVLVRIDVDDHPVLVGPQPLQRLQLGDEQGGGHEVALAGAHPLTEDRRRPVEVQETDPAPGGAQDVAVGPLQRRAGDDRV